MEDTHATVYPEKENEEMSPVGHGEIMTLTSRQVEGKVRSFKKTVAFLECLKAEEHKS